MILGAEGRTVGLLDPGTARLDQDPTRQERFVLAFFWNLQSQIIAGSAVKILPDA